MVTEPNVIPLIDILLVLLIIFMLVSITKTRRAFDLQLPATSASSATGGSVVLEVAAGPSYRINRREIAADRLEQEVRDVFADRNERILFVEGARSVPYKDVAAAFDAARGAGVRVTAVRLP
jgi:biopolymer transport protein ExbD